MKSIVSLSFIFLPFFVFTQINGSYDHEVILSDESKMNAHALNSILNDYDRRYREELNISDQILIKVLFDSISNDCSKFGNILNSKKYSGPFVKELTLKLIESQRCPLKILSQCFYFFQRAGSIRSFEQRNYPILELLTENRNAREMFFRMMYKEHVICNSDYFLKYSNSLDQLKLKYLLQDYKSYMNDEKGKELIECEEEIIMLVIGRNLLFELIH